LRSDGTGGATVQASAVTIDDSGNISGLGTVGCGAITTSGNMAGPNAFRLTTGYGNRLILGETSSPLDISANTVRFGTNENYTSLQWQDSYLSLGSGHVIGWNSGSAASFAADVQLRRNATGPAAEIRAAGGLRVMNAAGSANAALACGTITLGTPKINFDSSGSRFIEYDSGSLNLGDGFANVLAIGSSFITCIQPFQLRAYTVATLPSVSANTGRMVQVTDSSVTTNGSTVAGGGSNRVIVFSNGTNWDVVVA
jgi:hypothetical protein